MRAALIIAVLMALTISSLAVGNCDGAGNCYVSKIATGSGSGADWTNACTDFNGACDVTSVSIRGTTIWVAGVQGNPIGPPYTATTFSAPDSGTTPVTIIEASSANHGTNTGWRKEYATAMLILVGPVTISTDNWVFNGQWRAANWRAYHDFAEDVFYPSMCANGGYWGTGYHFNIVNTTGTANALNISGSNVSIKYVQIHGTRTNTTATDAGVSYAAGVSNEYFGYNEVCFTGGNSINTLSGTNFTFEYNHLTSNHQGSPILSSSAINVGDVSGLTVRYNEFRDITGAAILTDGNADATAFTPNWYFYGNVVWWIPTSVLTTAARGGLAGGIVSLKGEVLNGGVIQVYNNTIAEINVPGCNGTIVCSATALTLMGSGGACPSNTRNCIGATAPVGTVYNNFWWDTYSAENVFSNTGGNPQWSPTGDYGEGACLTTGCSNNGAFITVGANDTTASIANPFVSFQRPALTTCWERPNIWNAVQDQYQGCFFDFGLTIDTAAGIVPPGWTAAPSGCSSVGGGNCENVDRIGVVRGTLGSGSQVSRGAFQYLARRLLNTINTGNKSFTPGVAVSTAGIGVYVGNTATEIPVCSWTSAPTKDACPDSTPPFVKTWGALNPDVATISNTGVVTGVSAHNAFMSLNYGGYTDYNINVVVTTGNGTQPLPALPTGIVRTGSPTAFASYDTTQFDANFPTIYSDPCPATVVGGCTRWGTAGSPIPVITTSAQFTSALNSSVPGDTIVLQAGTTYSTNGAFTMPARPNPNKKWTYIISSNEAQLPPPGTRVSPNDAVNMPILAQTGGSSTLSMAAQADHWWVSGMQGICSNTVGTPRPVCGPRISTNSDVLPGDMPDSLVVDRCYFHGDDNHDTNHGVVLNASHFALLDSYIYFFGENQSQAQAFSISESPGPGKVINNLIGNGWGQDSIMGGAGGYSNPYVVQDAYFARNTFLNDPSYRAAGITLGPAPEKWEYANNFELKSCLRCLMDGNLIENSWKSVQGGGQFIMNAGTGVNGPNVVVSDVTFSNNILLGAVQGLGNGGQFASQFNGCDPLSQPCYYPGENRRIYEANNLWVQGPQGAPGGRAAVGGLTIAQTLDRFTTDFLFQHNTLVGPYLTDHTYCDLSAYFNPQTGDSPATTNVWVLDNVTCRHVTSNLAGTPGTAMLNQVMSDPASVPVATRFYGNVMEYFPGAPLNDVQGTWPPNNQSVLSTAVTYVSPSTGNYQLVTPVQQPSDSGPNSTNAGINYSVLMAHQAPALGSCSIAGTVTGAISSGVALTLFGGSTVTIYSNPDGTYTFPNLKAGSYTVAPFAIPPYPASNTYTFSPTSAAVTLTSGSCAASLPAFTSTASATFSISGTITLSGGGGQSGVSVALTGTSSGTATTDASGNYTFPALGPGSYTLKPSHAGFTYSPATLAETISTANITGANFTASPATTFSISGTVTGAVLNGVSVQLGGAGAGTAITDASGNYSFANEAAGVYTLTPSLINYTFTPANQSVTVSNANVTVPPFTSVQAPIFSISGTISGAVSSGVTLTLTGGATGTTTSGTGGAYTFSNLGNGNYTVTPSLAGFTFTPALRGVTISGANANGQNFTSNAVIVVTGAQWKVGHIGPSVQRQAPTKPKQ